MSDVIRPLGTSLNAAEETRVYMTRELEFDGPIEAACEFARPFKLQPHLEVWNKEFGPRFHEVFKGCPFQQYSPEDILKLADPARRAWTSNACI
jgi:hypothetical protein